MVMKNDKKHLTKTSASKKTEIEAQKKMQNIIVSFSIIVTVLFFFTVLIRQCSKDVSLDRNLKYEKAIVTKFGMTGKGLHYLIYEFVVNDKEYQGSGIHYPRTDTFSIGDTIEIFYDETDPENNTQLRSYRPSFWSGDNRRYYIVPVPIDTNLQSISFRPD